jgi:[protein-PII] uridylyltransferase
VTAGAPPFGDGDGDVTADLRATREALNADTTLRGSSYGVALAGAVDAALVTLLGRTGAGGDVALVALGSYARRELCPGSDIDVLLVLPEGRRRRGRAKAAATRDVAERLWYPLWDAGFVTGHGARTVRDSLTLMGEDLDAFTALLDIRYLAGDLALARDLAARTLDRARERRAGALDQLAGGAELRRTKPGLVAEMLEPNLKDGAGGLRDVHALTWAAALVTGHAGRDGLVESGLIDAPDAARVDAANETLLDLRVALHRITGGHNDVLAFQDQDAVAAALDFASADQLMRDLAAAGRAVAWIARDMWQRLAPDGSRVPLPDHAVNDRLVVREGRIAFAFEDSPSARDVLSLAANAAWLRAPIAPETLVRLPDAPPPVWEREERDAFVALLRAGRNAIPVFEALDHVDVLTNILPEWANVRFRPQRNAYHRFTVDRHLIEVVAECATLLDGAELPRDDQPFEGTVARALRRPELLLLGALLHDIGKGLPGDHSEAGSSMAASVARRMRFDSEAIEILQWLVRDHLLMADTATRRDLSDEAMVRRFCDTLACDPERLRLLYLLTIGDSIATGPAAWSRAKGALLRDLFIKATAIVETDSAASVAAGRRELLNALIGEQAAADFLAVLPASYLLAFDVDVMITHRTLLSGRGLQIDCSPGPDGRLVVTVVAPPPPPPHPPRSGAPARRARPHRPARDRVGRADVLRTRSARSEPLHDRRRHGARCLPCR